MIRLTTIAILTCIFSLVVPAELYAQSEVLLLGGHQFEGEYLSEDEERVEFRIVTKRNKIKDIVIWKERIFSITTDGQEKIYYETDTADEDAYTAEEMRMYIFGQQDANANHKTTIPILVTGAVTTTLAFYFGYNNSALLLTTPLIGALAGSATQGNKPKQDQARNPDVLSQPAYVEGYIKAARSKKILNTIKAGVVGGIVGSVAGIIASNNMD